MNANSNNQTPEADSQALSELSFSEAPASWNTRYVDPNGFECQITLRCEKGRELLEKASSAITYLLQAGCTPYTYYRSAARPSGNTSSTEEPKNGKDGHKDYTSWCPIHECEMKRWERDGRAWYSHKVDGEWCRGK